MSKILLGVILSLGWQAFANATVVGNGGDAIVCRDENEKIRSAQLLDYYEAESERNETIRLNPQNTTRRNFDIMIERLSVFEPLAPATIAKMYDDFFSQSRFLANVNLEDIPDSHHLSVPRNCKIEQLAIQKIDDLGGKYYTVNKDLWDQMNSVDRAGLIMHEVLYKRFINGSRKVRNSTRIRYINSLLAADRFQQVMDLESYVSLLSTLNFSYMMYEGLKVRVPSIRFREKRIVRYKAIHDGKKFARIPNFAIYPQIIRFEEVEYQKDKMGFKYRFDFRRDETVRYEYLGVPFESVDRVIEIIVDPEGNIVDFEFHFYGAEFGNTKKRETIICGDIDVTDDQRILCLQADARIRYGFGHKESRHSMERLILNSRLEKLIAYDKDAVIDFYQTGLIKRIRCSQGWKYFKCNSRIDYLKYPNGETRQSAIGESSRWFGKGRTESFKLRLFYSPAFKSQCAKKIPIAQWYENGQVKSGYVRDEYFSRHQFIEKQNGDYHKVSNGDLYFFDEKGLLTKVIQIPECS